MSENSNIQGRAYEYATLLSLYDEISKHRRVSICNSGSLLNCKHAWELLSAEMQSLYALSAKAAVVNILALEPKIIEATEDILELSIQPDSAGEQGDVRDILILRSAISWEIGLSLKHNNFAVKHSRLATNLDFGESWFGEKCSDKYWESVKPIFNMLAQFKAQNLKFSDIEDKSQTIYLPILKAFIDELSRILNKNGDKAAKLVEYLLGRYDFYKIISVDAKKYTTIQSVNINGTLSQPSPDGISPISIPRVKLPRRLIYIGLIPGRDTTAELYLDNGWQFTFRIHNASTMAEPSLKFDIQIVGVPMSVITINQRWT